MPGTSTAAPALDNISSSSNTKAGEATARVPHAQVYVWNRPFSSFSRNKKLPPAVVNAALAAGVCHFQVFVALPEGKILTYDFGPLGNRDTTLRSDNKRGTPAEIREHVVDAVPSDALHMGSVKNLKVEDIRAYNAQQPTYYKLHKSDCRHYCNRFISHFTGTRTNATVQLLRAQYQARVRKERGQLLHLLQHNGNSLPPLDVGPLLQRGHTLTDHQLQLHAEDGSTITTASSLQHAHSSSSSTQLATTPTNTHTVLVPTSPSFSSLTPSHKTAAAAIVHGASPSQHSAPNTGAEQSVVSTALTNQQQQQQQTKGTANTVSLPVSSSEAVKVKHVSKQSSVHAHTPSPAPLMDSIHSSTPHPLIAAGTQLWVQSLLLLQGLTRLQPHMLLNANASSQTTAHALANNNSTTTSTYSKSSTNSNIAPQTLPNAPTNAQNTLTNAHTPHIQQGWAAAAAPMASLAPALLSYTHHTHNNATNNATNQNTNNTNQNNQNSSNQNNSSWWSPAFPSHPHTLHADADAMMQYFSPHNTHGAAAVVLPLLSRLPPWHAPVFTALQWITDCDNWEQVEQLQKVGATTAAAVGGMRAWGPVAPHAHHLLRVPLDFSMVRLPGAITAAASLVRLPRFAALAALPTVGSTFVRLPIASARQALAGRVQAAASFRGAAAEVAKKGSQAAAGSAALTMAATNSTTAVSRSLPSHHRRLTPHAFNPRTLLVSLPGRVLLRPARRLARSGARLLSRRNAQHKQRAAAGTAASNTAVLSTQQQQQPTVALRQLLVGGLFSSSGKAAQHMLPGSSKAAQHTQHAQQAQQGSQRMSSAWAQGLGTHRGGVSIMREGSVNMNMRDVKMGGGAAAAFLVGIVPSSVTGVRPLWKSQTASKQQQQSQEEASHSLSAATVDTAGHAQEKEGQSQLPHSQQLQQPQQQKQSQPLLQPNLTSTHRPFLKYKQALPSSPPHSHTLDAASPLSDTHRSSSSRALANKVSLSANSSSRKGMSVVTAASPLTAANVSTAPTATSAAVVSGWGWGMKQGGACNVQVHSTAKPVLFPLHPHQRQAQHPLMALARVCGVHISKARQHVL